MLRLKLCCFCLAATVILALQGINSFKPFYHFRNMHAILSIIFFISFKFVKFDKLCPYSGQWNTFHYWSWTDSFNPLVTNGFSHSCHLDEFTFNLRGIRNDFIFISVFDEYCVFKANRIAPDGTPHFAASHLGLFCLPMSHKMDARLIRVKPSQLLSLVCSLLSRDLTSQKLSTNVLFEVVCDFWKVDVL